MCRNWRNMFETVIDLEKCDSFCIQHAQKYIERSMCLSGLATVPLKACNVLSLYTKGLVDLQISWFECIRRLAAEIYVTHTTKTSCKLKDIFSRFIDIGKVNYMCCKLMYPWLSPQHFAHKVSIFLLKKSCSLLICAWCLLDCISRRFCDWGHIL